MFSWKTPFYWKAAVRSLWIFLQGKQPQLSQPIFTGDFLHPSDHLYGPSLDSLQEVHTILMLGALELHAALQLESHKGRFTSLALLVVLLLMQPRMQLAFWAVSTHWQPVPSYASTSTPKSFFAGLLSNNSLPSLYLCLGLSWPCCRTTQLAFAQSHLPGLHKPLWRASFLSRLWTAAHSLMSLANLLRVLWSCCPCHWQNVTKCWPLCWPWGRPLLTVSTGTLNHWAQLS